MNPMHGKQFPQTRNAPRTTRQEKGRRLFDESSIVEILAGWSVLGDSHKVYLVTACCDMSQPPYACDCRDYELHAGQPCKHIWSVEYFRRSQGLLPWLTSTVPATLGRAA